MKFCALALDYNGTIAENGKPNPAVMEAIQQARRRGIVVVLVTGRTLSDLRRVAGDLNGFEAVVAENGAVLEFPHGRTRVLGRAPPPALLEELRQRGVEFTIGDCVAEAHVTAAPRILEAVQKLELPLVLAFNRSRVMVLPQGISKLRVCARPLIRSDYRYITASRSGTPRTTFNSSMPARLE
jgi:hypothetical protein